MGRYPFGVELFHLLLHAGLSRRFHKIEHRLFSQITLNWRGRPLTSHEIIVELIGATTTDTGLTVPAELDTGTYQRVAVQPWWRDYAAAAMSGVRAGGSHAPVVNRRVIASRVSRPHLVAVDR